MADHCDEVSPIKLVVKPNGAPFPSAMYRQIDNNGSWEFVEGCRITVRDGMCITTELVFVPSSCEAVRTNDWL